MCTKCLAWIFYLVWFIFSFPFRPWNWPGFHTWGSQKVCRSVLDTRKGAGDSWQEKGCLLSPKGNYLCNQNVTCWSSGWNNRPEHWELSHAEGMVLPQHVLHWWVQFPKQMQPLLCLLSQGPDPGTLQPKGAFPSTGTHLEWNLSFRHTRSCAQKNN